MRWRVWALVGGVASVLGLLAVTNYVVAPVMIDKAIAQLAPPPPAVAAAPAAVRTLGTELSGVGSIEAVQGVNIAAEVAGTVREIRFRSGEIVQRGQVLVVLNNETETADIAAARAMATNSQRELDRAKQLLSDGWITKAQFDQRQAARDQARAMVNRAQADTAKRAIRAPFTGRVGIRQIDLGQYLDAGVPIVSLQTVDPVYATAMLPEQAIAQVRVGQPVRVTTDTWTGRVFTGRITALESAIDPSTRTLKVQATLDNPDRALTPGLYAQLSVDLPDARPVVTVPETAIAYSLSGDTVYVLTPSKDAKSVYTVSRRSVQVGQSQPGFVEITAGLKPGEMVATNGQHKLREGGQAVIDNRLALASRPTPPRP